MKNIVTSLKAFLLLSVLVFSISACNRGKNNAIAEDLPPGTHAVSVVDVIQTSNYSYLQVMENDEKFWIAVAKREVKSGDILYYTDAMEMTDFKSKELNRTFSSIFFVNDPSETPVKAELRPSGKVPAQKMGGITVETAEGGINLATLFKDRASYAGKTVKISGVVVKSNQNIMKKNWAHIQDGSEFEGNFDLTVTTLDTVEEGSVVTFEGVINLDKDFGAGYAYDIIMEDAKALHIKNAADAHL